MTAIYTIEEISETVVNTLGVESAVLPEITETDNSEEAQATVEMSYQETPDVLHTDDHLELVDAAAQVAIAAVSRGALSAASEQVDDDDTDTVESNSPIRLSDESYVERHANTGTLSSSNDTSLNQIERDNGNSPTTPVDIALNGDRAACICRNQTAEFAHEGTRLSSELAETRRQLWELESWLLGSQIQLASLEAEQLRLATEGKENTRSTFSQEEFVFNAHGYVFKLFDRTLRAGSGAFRQY
jgi:hypothetical protein